MILLESSALVVEVYPEVGGKVGQIREKASGREFLIPPQRQYRTIPFNGDWLQHDTSGMDDCFPNVAAGAYPEPPWSAVRLPDLGEWTHAAWRVTETREREVTLEMTGHALPYYAAKTVSFVDERTLNFSYRVENRGESDLRYLWSAHPLIAVDDAYEVRLPAGDLSLRVFPSEEYAFRWPIFGGRDISREWIPACTTLKVFVSGLTEGWCSLHLPTHTLRFSFDASILRAVGIWLNNFGFPRSGERAFRCIAIEPCTSPSDLLDGLEASDYPRIAAGEVAQWSMQMAIVPRALAEA